MSSSSRRDRSVPGTGNSAPERLAPPPGYKTQSPDTEYWAERLIFDRYRTMTVLEKAKLLSDLTASVHQISMAGLRERRPGLSEEELEFEAAALRLGRDFLLQFTGRNPASDRPDES
jgi:hypothetical protein